MSEHVNGFEPAQTAQPPVQVKPTRPKRMPNQFCNAPPPGAKPQHCLPLGFGASVVPVSAVAKDWGVSARRIRTMLSTGRLSGKQHENGYWEVFFPYKYIFGTRGPVVKKLQQRQPDKRKKPERMPEW